MTRHQAVPASAWLAVASAEAAAVTATRLAFNAIFYLDLTVSPAPDEVTSTTATGVGGPHGRAVFTTTHWSVVLEAQGESPAAQEALEKLCRTYWRPIYSFLRRQGRRPEEAEDLTQGFFALLLERRNLERCPQGERDDFVLICSRRLKYFLANEQPSRDGDQARKRSAAHPVGRTAR